MSTRPRSLPIRPAGTASLSVSVPWSKTLIAVTLPSSPEPPKVIRSRMRRVPENIRAYAIFSPARPRSTLNTVPESGPWGSPSAAGRSSLMPVISASTPAPVMAEPK